MWSCPAALCPDESSQQIQTERAMTDDSLPNDHHTASGFRELCVRFDPAAFQQAILRYCLVLLAILTLAPALGEALMPVLQGHVSETEIFKLPLYDTAGPVSLGVLAMGPAALRGVRFGR